MPTGQSRRYWRSWSSGGAKGRHCGQSPTTSTGSISGQPGAANGTPAASGASYWPLIAKAPPCGGVELGRGRLLGFNLPELCVFDRYIYLSNKRYCLQHLFVNKYV